MDFAKRILATHWWDTLSPEHQEQYLKEHPGSKYGKTSKSNSNSEGTPDRSPTYREDPAELKDREQFSTDEAWVPDDTEYGEHTLNDEDLTPEELEVRNRIKDLRKRQKQAEKKSDTAALDKLQEEENELLDKYGDAIAPGRHFYRRTFTERLAKKVQKFFQKLSGNEQSFFKNGGADADSEEREDAADHVKANKKEISKKLRDSEDWPVAKKALKDLKLGKKLSKGAAKSLKSFGKGLAIACALSLVGAAGPVLPLIGLVMASDFLKFLGHSAKSIFSSTEVTASEEDEDDKMLDELIDAWAEHLKTTQLSDDQVEQIIQHLAEEQKEQ